MNGSSLELKWIVKACEFHCWGRVCRRWLKSEHALVLRFTIRSVITFACSIRPFLRNLYYLIMSYILFSVPLNSCYSGWCLCKFKSCWAYSQSIWFGDPCPRAPGYIHSPFIKSPNIYVTLPSMLGAVDSVRSKAKESTRTLCPILFFVFSLATC